MMIEFSRGTKEFIKKLPKGERKAILKMLEAVANVFPISIDRCEFLNAKQKVIVIAINWNQLIFHKKKGRRTTIYANRESIVADWKDRAIQLVINQAKYLTGL